MSNQAEKERQYWDSRFKQLEKAKTKTVESYLEEIKRAYENASRIIDERIAVFYQRYAQDEKISLEEAYKQLSPTERKQLQMNVQEYITKGELNALDYNEALARELERASTAFRITRLEALQLEIKLQAMSFYNQAGIKIYEALQTVGTEANWRAAYEIFKGTGLIDTAFVGIDPYAIDLILREPWVENVTFSERIWLHQNVLMQELAEALVDVFLNGENYHVAAKKLQKKMDTSFFNAARIVDTEAAYIYGEAQQRCFEELGVEYYRFRSELSSTVCPRCGATDSHIFKVSERVVGVNAVPMHPFCHCYEIPAVDLMNRTRVGRDENDRNVKFPASMTYTEWKRKYMSNNLKSSEIPRRQPSDLRPTLRITNSLIRQLSNV